jgi:hypothetical protein
VICLALCRNEGHLSELFVQPVQRASIEQRAIAHLAVAGSTFRRGEPKQSLGATQRVEQEFGVAGQVIVFGLRDQGWALDEFRSAIQVKSSAAARKSRKLSTP